MLPATRVLCSWWCGYTQWALGPQERLRAEKWHNQSSVLKKTGLAALWVTAGGAGQAVGGAWPADSGTEAGHFRSPLPRLQM